MSLVRVTVLCLLFLCLLVLTEARNRHRGGRRRGRGRAEAHRVPHGPLCRITNAASGANLYSDEDACVLQSHCAPNGRFNLTCGDYLASFWFCTPKLHFLKGACIINERDLGKNCTCNATSYNMALSDNSQSQITVRFCEDHPWHGARGRHRGHHHHDDDDDDDNDDELEFHRRPRFGQSYNNFDINTCQRPGRQGSGGRNAGRHGGHRRGNRRG